MKTKKIPKIPTLGERLDAYIATAPRSKPWYSMKERCWKKGHTYITKRAVFAIFMEYRRARALQAMAELDAEIAAEEAAERRRLKRKTRTKTKAKRKRSTH